MRNQHSKMYGHVRVVLAAALLSWTPALSFGQAQGVQGTESVADAARAARQRTSQAGTHPRVITNDDTAPRRPAASSASFPLGFPETAQLDSSSSANTSCYDAAAAQALEIELQAAQDDRDQFESELSQQSAVISDNDLDLRDYKPGYSGISVGSAPLQESQSQPSARVELATVDQKIAALKKSLQLACDTPEASPIRRKLDAVENELKWSQRQLALDQDNFYLNPGYARDTAGQAYLDAEQGYVDALVAEKAQLEEQLAAIRANESPDGQSSSGQANTEQTISQPGSAPSQSPSAEIQ